MAKAKAKPKKPATKPAKKPAPQLVTAATITRPQLRELLKLSKEAGDELADYCKVALSTTASRAKRKEALALCVDTWNALQTL